MVMLVLFSLIFLTAYTQDEEHTCVNAVTIDSANLESEIAKHKVSLILFYAPWCGHCKRLMPDYDNLCKDIKEKFGDEALCARLDCTRNEQTCTSHNLKGYPTIKGFIGGKICDYEGPRVAQNIYGWFKSVFYSSSDAEDVKLVKELMASSNHSLIAYISQKSHLRPITDEISCKFDVVNYLIINNPDVAAEIGITEADSFTVFKKEAFYRSFLDIKSSDELLRVVFFTVNPLVPAYSPATVPTIFSPLVNNYIGFIHDSDESYNGYMETLESFSLSQLPFIRVFTVNSSDETNRDVVNFFNVDKLPAVVFYDDIKQRFYHMKDMEINVDNLVSFAMGCMNGSIPPFVKKQPVPEGWDEASVKVLVVDNFNEVFSKYSGGMVLFYAPWCGHCEAFMPTWHEFGDYVKINYPNLFIGKLDHTENEIPDIDVPGYPTVIAFKSLTEKIPYAGGRTMDDLKKFITDTFGETVAQPASDSEKVMDEEKREEL